MADSYECFFDAAPIFLAYFAPFDGLFSEIYVIHLVGAFKRFPLKLYNLALFDPYCTPYF